MPDITATLAGSLPRRERTCLSAQSSRDEPAKHCYRRLNPMEEPSVTVRVHLDVLQYTRTGLRTRGPIALTTSRHNRVVLERPRLTTPSLAAQFGFALDRAFPLPATLSLLWSYRDQSSPLPPFGVPQGGRGVLQVFGHAEATGDESHNKSLSERRADVVLALLESDVDRMVSLAADDGWTSWEYQVLLRVLGSDPGPTDGDPGELTDLAVAQFGRRYRAGFFHRRGEAPRVAELKGRAFDASTVEALLDAFVHAHAPDLAGCSLDATHRSVGCSEFNVVANGMGAQNRRVSLIAGLDSPHPENAPCKRGDANACAVIGGGVGEYGCMWYREHVDAEPPYVPALYDPRWLSVADGSYILSVLTNLPDGTEVMFDVFGHDTPVPTARALADLEHRWAESLRAPSVGGVSTVRWAPPPEFEGQGASVPVFRVATEANVAHAWANPLDYHGVQLLDPNGRCFSGTALTFDTAAGPLEVSTDADGIAWVRADPESPPSVQIADDLVLPHPGQRRIVVLDQSSAPLDAERGAAVELHGGRVVRVRVLPPDALSGYVSCHFDEGSTYPADTILALAKQAQDAAASEPGTRLALFGHARRMSSPEAEKGLSERRARFVHALLTADVDALVTAVEDDGWDESAFVALAHFLGHLGKTPMEVFASFQWGYSAGEHHAPELGLGRAELEATGLLDEATKRGLLDAFVATAGASLPEDAFAPTPCAGCASFNPPPDGEHPDRVTLVVLPPDRASDSVPCRMGDVGACHVGEEGTCEFFAERVLETSLKYRWVDDDAVSDDEDVLTQGARVRVHHGQRVAAAVYRVPPLVEDVAYAFVPPPTSSVPVAAEVSPRVHRTRPEDVTIKRGMRKSRRVRADAVPDGQHIRPTKWDDDGQTIDELFLDLWAVTLRQVSQKSSLLSRADLATYRDLLEESLPAGATPSIPAGTGFDPYRVAGDSKFEERALVAALVASGLVLDPRRSERYDSDPFAGLFACNIFASDLVGILPHGAWLPKVQFTHPKRVREDPSLASTEKVTDVGPSGLNDFLTARLGVGGADYGWIQIPGDPLSRVGRHEIRKEAQRRANLGDLVLFSGATKKSSGHVGVVMPDLEFLGASVRGNLGRVGHRWGTDNHEVHEERHAPFRSQAGGIMGHGIRGGVLVLAKPGRLRTPGYFAYDPSLDKSRGSDVER